jgi:hypothetical protein
MAGIGHTGIPNLERKRTMADVWSLKGFTDGEREIITRRAKARDLAYARYIMKASDALENQQPTPEGNIEEALQRLEQMARITKEVGGLKDRASQAIRRTVRHAIEGGGIVTAIPTPPKPGKTIEGTPAIPARRTRAIAAPNGKENPT